MFSHDTIDEETAVLILKAEMTPQFLRSFKELGRDVGYRNLARAIARLSESDLDTSESGGTAANDESEDD
jgi:hypothetical protein